MKIRHTVVLALSAVLVTGAARAEGWSLGGLNPFANKNKTTKQTINGKVVNGNTKAKPGILSTVTSAPKKAWNGTKSLLAPSKKAPPRKPTGLQSSREFHAKEETKESWTKSLFAKDEPKPPKSVSEWMRLEQVKPGITQ